MFINSSDYINLTLKRQSGKPIKTFFKTIILYNFLNNYFKQLIKFNFWYVPISFEIVMENKFLRINNIYIKIAYQKSHRLKGSISKEKGMLNHMNLF